MQKGTSRTKLWRQSKERDQTAPYCFNTARRGQIAKIKKVEGETTTRENLSFWTYLSALALLCSRVSAKSQVFVISAQFEEESRGAQKTKVLCKRSKINPEVESRWTDQQRARKFKEKQVAVQKVPAVAEFGFRPWFLQFWTKSCNAPISLNRF